jgi:hypothetical protein
MCRWVMSSWGKKSWWWGLNLNSSPKERDFETWLFGNFCSGLTLNPSPKERDFENLWLFEFFVVWPQSEILSKGEGFEALVLKFILLILWATVQ